MKLSYLSFGMTKINPPQPLFDLWTAIWVGTISCYCARTFFPTPLKASWRVKSLVGIFGNSGLTVHYNSIPLLTTTLLCMLEVSTLCKHM